MRLGKRYYFGEDITLIRLYLRENHRRRYLKIHEVVTQCINQEIQATDILFDTFSLTIESETHHGEYRYGYVGSWVINPKTEHRLLGLNRLPVYKHVNGFDNVLDVSWEIIEYRFDKSKAYDAIDLRFVNTFLKTHESVMFPLIRAIRKTLEH